MNRIRNWWVRPWRNTQNLLHILATLGIVGLYSPALGQTPIQFDHVPSQAFQEAYGLFFQYRFDEIEEAMLAVADDESEPAAARAFALMHVAWLRWHLENDLEGALPDFDRALEIDPRNARVSVEKARALAHFRQYDAALDVLADARDHFGFSAQADLDRARGAGLVADAILTGGLDETHAQLGFDLLDPAYTKIAVLPDVGAPMLRLGIATLQPDRILQGWDTYYLETADGRGTSQLAEARAMLVAALKDWPGGEPSVPQRRQMAQALIGGAYPHLAARLSSTMPPEGLTDSVTLRLAVPYSIYLLEIQHVMHEYHRRALTGDLPRKDPKPMRDALAPANDRFWKAARKIDPAIGDMTGTKFLDLMRRHFHTYVTEDFTDEYYGIRMAHIVSTDQTVKTQYGRSAKFTSYVLDGFVSNGAMLWFFDGRGGTGGWATTGSKAYYMVRPAFVGMPFAHWAPLTEPDAKAAKAKQLADLTAQDAQFGERVRFYPGAASRLVWRGVTAIYDRAVVKYSGRGLFNRFISEFYRIFAESSIDLHEGRHALDFIHAKDENLTSADYEYRAKLSELAFGEQPELTLQFIFAPNMGSPTPHGEANMRIMTDFADWMEAHADEIPGFDASRPAITQIDLLTNDQIHAIARSNDPWAKD